MIPVARQRARRRTRAVAVLGALAALAGSAPAQADAPAPQDAESELQFLRETVDHHFMGVKMGEACLRRATVRSLRDLCAGIVVNQATQISQMRMMMLRDWYGVDEQPTLTAAQRRALRRMRARRGKAFDRTISRQFIGHHRIQIRRARSCVKTADHADLRNLCRRQINGQVREIREFRHFL